MSYSVGLGSNASRFEVGQYVTLAADYQGARADDVMQITAIDRERGIVYFREPCKPDPVAVAYMDKLMDHALRGIA